MTSDPIAIAAVCRPGLADRPVLRPCHQDETGREERIQRHRERVEAEQGRAITYLAHHEVNRPLSCQCGREHSRMRRGA